MEASTSTVASHHFSSSSFSSLPLTKVYLSDIPRRSYNPPSSSSWIGSTHSLSFSSRNSFTREAWRVINLKNAVNSRKKSVIRADMFGQLTSGLEAAWNKLKGEEALTRENIAEPMRDIRRALLEADV
nr:signal recognition particle 54 kDa protein, chloroplastic [Ipomoea batatas]